MDTNDTFNLDQAMDDFLAFKRSLGYDYAINEAHLDNLRRHIAKKLPIAHALDESIVISWSAQRKNESAASMLRRISTIKELARYLISIGQNAYILPKSYAPKARRYVPHIFTRPEIDAFFKSLDEDFLPTTSDPKRHFDARAVFRIMYCCGLRPGEVTKLAISDVDLDYGNLFVRDAKGRRDRIVPFDEGLKEYLTHYDAIASAGRDRSSFIAGKGDNPRKAAEIGQWFRLIWDKLLPAKIAQNVYARAYDFRHHHPTRRMALWMEEGIDIAAKQVFLMNYMGHSGFKETDYYIHLTEDMYGHLAETMEAIGFRYWGESNE